MLVTSDRNLEQDRGGLHMWANVDFKKDSVGGPIPGGWVRIRKKRTSS